MVTAAVATVGVAATIATGGAVAPAVGATLGTFTSATGIPLGIALFSNPVGWAMVGHDGLDWDCWKPIVRDPSLEKSKGRPLRELLKDERVKEAEMNEDFSIHVTNKWDEKFLIQFVIVDGSLAAHASRI